MAAEAPSWVVREDAALPVLVALYLRQALGIRHPEELPHLRGILLDIRRVRRCERARAAVARAGT
jgi:hypothetical protein